MTRFERELVEAFNAYFKAHNINAIAYRRKQHRYTDQVCDILVDSSDKRFYLAIENKSISEKVRDTIYFSQHFSGNGANHQILRTSEFLKKSGRRGFLALELKRGRGKQRLGILIPWETVHSKFTRGEVGIKFNDLGRYIKIDRTSKCYDIASLFNGRRRSL